MAITSGDILHAFSKIERMTPAERAAIRAQLTGSIVATDEAVAMLKALKMMEQRERIQRDAGSWRRHG